MSGLSPEQLEMRREGITATDVAAVVGVHPQRTPLDVFLEKTGQAKSMEDSHRSKWGQLLEPVIRSEYAERHRVSVELHGTLRHPRDRWMMATPDGLCFPFASREADRGLEIKVHGRDAVFFGGLEYGSPGTDEVPPHELVQCAWGQAVTGLPRWDLVAFLDGAPAEYTIDRDDDLLAMLKEEAARFRVDYILTNTRPPPDGSKAWDEWLKRRWTKNTQELVSIDDDQEMLALVAALRAARDEEKASEKRTEAIVQTLKERIGDKSGLLFHEPGRSKPSSITWRYSKEGVTTSWKESFEAIRDRAAIVASANESEMRDAIAILSAAGGFRLEAGALTMTAAKVAELVKTAQDTLRELARATPTTSTKAAARPFNVPRHWGKSKSDKPDNTEEN